MKKFSFYFLILIFLTSSNYAFSEKIVYANLDKIATTSEVGTKILKFFKNENQKLINEIKAEENKIREKEKSLISQKNILEEDEYLKKVENLQNEVQNFNIKNNDKSKQIQKNKDEVYKSFLSEINKILKEFAEINNIDIILSSNQMLIGKSELDVTDELLKLVNSKIRNFDIKK